VAKLSGHGRRRAQNHHGPFHPGRIHHDEPAVIEVVVEVMVEMMVEMAVEVMIAPAIKEEGPPYGYGYPYSL
jgi:hypothetical protein